MIKIKAMNRSTQMAVVLLLLINLGPVNVFAADTNPLQDSAWSNKKVTTDTEISDPLLRQGKLVYDARCLICHGEIPDAADPQGMPAMTGTQALLMRYRGEIPAVLEQRTDLTPDFIRVIVRKGSNVMPALRPVEISDADLAAVAAWLSRDNP